MNHKNMVDEAHVNESQKHDRKVHVNEIVETWPKRCMLINHKNMVKQTHVNESQKHDRNVHVNELQKHSRRDTC